MLLRLENVVAGYGGGDVLRGVDLEVEQGSITCIVGPNGAGKSTVLRTISGLLRPRAGSVLFQDAPLMGLRPRQVLARGIVQVPQERSLFPEMTVWENLRLGAFILRDSRLVQRRLDEVSEMFPIVRERASDRAGSLSGGQQKIVEFARSLMLDPALVLLDEPSMGLAPILVDEVFRIISRLRAEGVTMLLVEQFAAAALNVADYGYVLENGRIAVHGPAEKLKNDPAVQAAYLGGSH